MAGKLTDLLNAGLTAQLPLSGGELVELAQDVGAPSGLKTRVVSVRALAESVADIITNNEFIASTNAGLLLHEDFLNPSAVPDAVNYLGPLALRFEGVGSVALPLDSNADRIGAVSLSTSPDAFSQAVLIAPALYFTGSLGEEIGLAVRMECFFLGPSFEFRTGFLPNIFYDPLASTDYGAFFFANHDLSEWQCAWRASSGDAWNIVSTGAGLADDLHDLRVELGCEASPGSLPFVRFTVDGTEVVRSFVSVPTTEVINPIGIYLYNQSSFAGCQATVDYVTLFGKYARRYMPAPPVSP